MPGMSIHVVDVARGLVAVGMPVGVFRAVVGGGRLLIASGVIRANGAFEAPTLNATLAIGTYEVDFGVASFYRAQGIELPAPPFLDVVTYRFGLADPLGHIHLPFKCTPWGYSCFRGGA